MKERYFSPETEVMELRLDGMIAASGDPQDYVDPFGGSELVF